MAQLTRCARARHRLAQRATRSVDGGFILIESIVAITVVTIVMAGLAMFFVNAVHSSGQNRAAQSATVVADNAIDQIRAVQKPSDLYSGRKSTAVAAQFTAAPSKVKLWLGQMYPAYNDTAGAAVVVPATMATKTVNNVVYTPTNYIGQCAIPVDPTKGTDCLTACPSTTPSALGSCSPGYASSIDTTPFLRVVVAVTWPDTKCAAGACAFVTSTLLSANPNDPDFLLQTTPPNAPVVANPGSQVSAVNDSVSLQLATTSNKVVNPIQWTVTNLPTGLSMTNPFSGLITGTPVATNGSGQTVSVFATDAFGRQSPTITFSWRIISDVSTNAPSTVAAVQYTPITNLVITASGGSGATYVWSVPTSGSDALPPGLSFATTSTTQATISGTPTTAGTYSSVITIKDSSGRSRTATITWTVLPRPIVTSLPTAMTVLTGWIASSPMTYTCPFTSCTFTMTGAPSGAVLSTTPSSTTGSASVVVPNGSGTLYATSVIPALGLVWTVSVTGTQTGTSNAGPATTTVWTKYALGLATLNDVSVSKNSGSTVSQNVSAACASAPCTVTFTGQSGNWLSLTSNGTLTSSLTITTATTSFWVRGTISTTPGAYPVSVTITDQNGNLLTETAVFTRGTT